MSDLASAPLPPTYGDLPSRHDDYDNVPPLSEGQRLSDVFFAPSRTFADIRRNRSWWVPYLIIAVMGLVFGAVATKRVGVDTLLENAQRNNPAQMERMQNATPEQRASGQRIGRVIMQTALFSGPVLVLVFGALIALLLWVGFNFILGGSSTYPGMFAVYLYASLPSLILTVLMIVTMLVGDPETFNINNPVGTNIGYYLSHDTSPFLRSLLGSFDVFTLWQVGLLGLGGAIVARVKKSTGLAMVYGVWFAIVLVKAGIAAI